MDKFLLNDKKQISWSEYGSPFGIPVFYFHGTPGSNIEASSADIIANELGVRLIAPDRPGYNESDVQDGFSLLDWANVIKQLADNLNIHKFSIIGYSAGGPYALACAHEIPDRINHIALISSMASFESSAMQTHINASFKPLYELAVTDLPATIQQVSQLANTVDSLQEALSAELPSVDLSVIQDKNFKTIFHENLTVSLKNGVYGIVNDLHNIAQPWQFDAQLIDHKIDIWHGNDDLTVGPAVGGYLNDILQDTDIHLLDNEGHFLMFSHWVDILRSIKNN
ncbi:MAG: alpha/beta hydrolase [Pseudomonadota bacterium]